MCGISAVINKRDTIAKHDLLAMQDALKHRGPDGHGVYLSEDMKIGFGHQRLSLVDLSVKGSQPMSKHNRTITFNGEIYNYRELLQELKLKGYTFSSHSDTEVILSAFEAWGIDCIQKLNGAFAFILYEHGTNDVYVVRDRIGEKPLYYTETSDHILFASEIKAFRNFPGVKLEPDLDTIKSNLIFHFFADKESTYFKNVQSLRPGHYIKISKSKRDFRKYWDVRPAEVISYENEKQRIAEEIDDIYSLLEDAVRIRLSADCPVGSLLSGGLDSSILTTIAAKISSYPIRCFTLCMTDQFDEDAQSAERLTKSVRNLEHTKVAINNELFSLENVDKATGHLEELALHKSLYLSKGYRAVQSHGLKTILNGQGSDEISLGYYNFYDFLRFSDEALLLDNFARYWYEQFTFKDYISKQDAPELIYKNLKKNFSPYASKDMLSSVTAFGVKTHLLNILNHEDRFSMAASVECRTAFTDYRIIEKLMSIPSKYKVYDGREKYLIRKLGERILPEGIAERKKVSFMKFAGQQEKVLIDSIVTDKGFKDSYLLNQLFSRSLFAEVYSLPLALQWKVANLYRFEKVFFN